jgi:histidinol-phosphate/aromatic aminotransferase/cobyric acid decarboxylase-like protein
VRGVEPESILPGAGSSDLIYLALRQWLSSQSRVLILDPMYGEYSHVLEHVIHCQVDRLPLSRVDEYAVYLDRLSAMIATGPDLVILVNPNNPTGRYVQRDALIQTMIAAPASTRFWIDETYLEYVGADLSLEQFAAASCNIVVCKSMSKVYALSGARVAYLCGPAELVAELRPLTPPWVVSLPGQVAAVMALRDPTYYANCYAQTHRLRQDLAIRLRYDCGLDVVPGVANFLLCHLPEDGPDANTVVQACRAHNLFIRDASNISRALGARTVRIAVKDAVTNRRMCELLQDVLQEVRRGTLVFDAVQFDRNVQA